MSAIFIDSDVFVGLNDQKDRHHAQANKILSSLKDQSHQFYVSTNILMETLTIISQRVGKQKGIELLTRLRSGEFTIIHPDEKLIISAEDIFRSLRSKNVSYSDCVSFAVMRRYGIQWVLSFDIHFKKKGFKRVGMDR